MDFDALVDKIQKFEGVLRKNSIVKITDSLKDVYNINGKTLVGFGDDSSAIDIENNKAVLVAADGIWGKLIDIDPYWAGYCSILVNVNDIVAMGGEPLAMVNILSVKDRDVGDEIIKGVVDGCHKFNVPMVGGHFHPDAEYNVLDVSIVGIVDKNHMITSFGAKVKDKVIVAIDLDGRQYPKSPLNWDTTLDKDDEIVQDQLRVMKTIAEMDLVSAGKDVSNPGILGTLEMLLESSKCGARVYLEKIPKNDDVSWEDWLRVYPGSGFVLTAPKENTDEIIKLLKRVSLESRVVGEIISDKKLYLNYDGNEKVVFDQDNNPVLNLT
ncbi:MAG: methanogenesis marker 2 protein [Methanobrevibacter sp.]|jgi:putative methanogenesis marker protein 2|nr:methanogenesis marker 2 protein [Candidatus Methanovirga aequatorialis]